MPVRYLNPEVSVEELTLQHALTDEWSQPSDRSEAPIILLDNDPIHPQQAPQHVYVVWDAWVRLNQRERSRLILNSYERVAGLTFAQAVTVAMGLTKDEADKLHIKYLG